MQLKLQNHQGYFLIKLNGMFSDLIPYAVDMLTLPVQGFSGSSAGKEFACNEGDLGLIPGLNS